MTRYLNLAEFFILAEQVTGLDAAILVKASRTDLADRRYTLPRPASATTTSIGTSTTRLPYSPAGSPGTIRFRTATSELRGRAW